MLRTIRSALLVLLTCSIAYAGEWDSSLAAKYLDQRQKKWFEWPPAQAPGGPCVSCHTGLPYLLARPQLRKTLGETNLTEFEMKLLDGLRTRLASGESMFKSLRTEELRAQGRSVEAVLSAVAFAFSEDASIDSRVKDKAWQRVWSLRNEGNTAKDRGLWPWFDLKLHPYESEASAYYGAALVAIAAGHGLTETEQNRDREHLQGLTDYLRREFPAQPFHNRLMALWASASLSGILDRRGRKNLVRELWKQQANDGGWSISDLGPWSERPNRPEVTGSSAYATALVVFTLQQAGQGCNDSRLSRAKSWLMSRQDPQTGSWSTPSMNKRYPEDSMQLGFINDAATSFAVLAFLDPGKCSLASHRNATFKTAKGKQSSP